MSFSSITTSIMSSLGNNTGSVIPIATKDLIQNQVLVAQYKKEGGEHDAFEKFVEENGTSVVWLGGLPLIKKIFDKTAYKAFKISPDVDIRKLRAGASDSVEFALNKLKEQGKAGGEQYNILKNVAEHKGLTKALFAGKFAAATAVTMYALAKIIMFKQKETEEKVKHKIALEMAEENAFRKSVNTSDVTKIFKTKLYGSNYDNHSENEQNPNELAFKGISNIASAFMYNPVLNQSLLDLGITGLRTKNARDGERRDVLVKEAFEIACLYPLAHPIQKGFDVLWGTLFNKNTSLDYGVLASDSFEKSVANGSIKEALSSFIEEVDIEKLGKDANVDKKMLNFIYDNPDNAIVKFLKDANEVQTVKEVVGKKFGIFNIKRATSEIDSLAFINMNSVKKNIKKLAKTVDNMDSKGAVGNIQKAAKYFSGAKAAKGLSILSAIAFGIWAMGVLQTKVVLKLRKDKTGTTENEAIVNLENKIRHQMAFQGLNENN